MWDRLRELWELLSIPGVLILVFAMVGLSVQLRRIEKQNLHIIRLLTGEGDH